MKPRRLEGDFESMDFIDRLVLLLHSFPLAADSLTASLRGWMRVRGDEI